jgi:hypothetical protein
MVFESAGDYESASTVAEDFLKPPTALPIAVLKGRNGSGSQHEEQALRTVVQGGGSRGRRDRKLDKEDCNVA